jgi:hypothetical protein
MVITSNSKCVYSMKQKCSITLSHTTAISFSFRVHNLWWSESSILSYEPYHMLLRQKKTALSCESRYNDMQLSFPNNEKTLLQLAFKLWIWILYRPQISVLRLRLPVIMRKALFIYFWLGGQAYLRSRTHLQIKNLLYISRLIYQNILTKNKMQKIPMYARKKKSLFVYWYHTTVPLNFCVSKN